MSKIQFNEDDDLINTSSTMRRSNLKHSSGLIGLVQKCSFGTITTDRGASVVLLIISIIAIVMALFVIPNSSNKLPNKDMHSQKNSDKPYYKNLSH